MKAWSRPRGFTLLELMMSVAIVGVLAALAIGSYTDYVIRGQLAQQLVDIDHIRGVVTLESRDGRQDLHLGARPGHAPPALAGQLLDREFNGLQGLRFQLVRVPGGLFAWQDKDSYGLVVDTTEANGDRRLRLLHHELLVASFRTHWLTSSSFLIGLGAMQPNGGSASVGLATQGGPNPGATATAASGGATTTSSGSTGGTVGSGTAANASSAGGPASTSQGVSPGQAATQQAGTQTSNAGNAGGATATPAQGASSGQSATPQNSQSQVQPPGQGHGQGNQGQPPGQSHGQGNQGHSGGKH